MSRSVTDAMSIVTAQTLGLQQLRREAAIYSAPKGFLTDGFILRRRLRRTSLFLFLEPQRKENLLGDLVPGVEVVAPPIEEPPPAR